MMPKKRKLRVIVAGGRDFGDYDDDYEFMCAQLDRVLQNIKSEIVIVSGAAKGADTLGERYARERGYEVESFPANWNRYGNMAGKKRNTEMAHSADALIAFWDKTSHGTAHMIKTAKRLKLQVIVINY